jgi:murein L,D-transpeptidase YcbB/YkuD
MQIPQFPQFPQPAIPPKPTLKNEVSLRAGHWRTRTNAAEFHVNLAANNSPPMRMGSAHTAQAVILVKEAYNRIRFEKRLAHFPALVETGIYDLNTSIAIGKFQAHFGLSADGHAGKQTLVKMDELLVELGR